MPRVVEKETAHWMSRPRGGCLARLRMQIIIVLSIICSHLASQPASLPLPPLQRAFGVARRRKEYKTIKKSASFRPIRIPPMHNSAFVPLFRSVTVPGLGPAAEAVHAVYIADKHEFAAVWIVFVQHF